MDTLVENGSFAANVCGLPVSINSVDEACQRVRFSLLTRKGSFAYDRELGADYDYLFSKSKDDIDVRMFACEAIASQKEISVGTVSAQWEDNSVTLSVEVIFAGESKITEVTINGNI